MVGGAVVGKGSAGSEGEFVVVAVGLVGADGALAAPLRQRRKREVVERLVGLFRRLRRRRRAFPRRLRRRRGGGLASLGDHHGTTTVQGREERERGRRRRGRRRGSVAGGGTEEGWEGEEACGRRAFINGGRFCNVRLGLGPIRIGLLGADRTRRLQL